MQIVNKKNDIDRLNEKVLDETFKYKNNRENFQIEIYGTYEGLLSDDIVDVAKNRDDLWLCSVDGLIKFESETGKFINFPFTNDNVILKAILGVAQSPCSLDIEIKKADWRYLPTVIEEAKRIVHKIKKQIFKTKLNFLFGLESEDITIKAFEKLKTNFDRAYALLVDLEERLQVNYAEKQRAEEIEQYQLQLYLANEEFSAAIEGYRAAQNAALLSDAIEIYIDKILELQKLIQETKYAEIYVDKEKKDGVLILDREPPDKYVLKAFPLGILQNEEEWEPGTIIRNLK